MNKLSDEWQTPQWLFDELNKEFDFDIDLCATKENSKCDDFCLDYLKDAVKCISEGCSFFLDWKQGPFKTAFLNPPYSNPKPFIEKAWEDSKHCKIVCLVKCDPSTKWWGTFWDYNLECPFCWKPRNEIEASSSAYKYRGSCNKCDENMFYRGPKPGCEVRFLPKRVQFDPPQELIDNGDVWEEEYNIVTCKPCHGSDAQLIYEDYFCEYCKNQGHTSKKKWVKQCDWCTCADTLSIYPECEKCKGAGHVPLRGPTFPSAIVIMDRRYV